MPKNISTSKMQNQFSKDKQKKLNKIFKDGNVALAYLFGSYAFGYPGPLSDLDFAVLFSKNVKEDEYFDKELKLAGNIGRLFKIDRVDIINLAVVEDPLLKYNAVFSGKFIFGKDQKLRFALERKIMQEYEDTKHLRAVQNYYLVKHIKEGTFGKPRISLLRSKYLEKYVATKQRNNQKQIKSFR